MRIMLVNWNPCYKFSIATAKKLSAAGFEIVYWVGGSCATEQIRGDFPRTIFHSSEDALRGIPAKEFASEKFTPPGEDFINNFYEAESVLSTLKQVEKFSESGFKKKNLYHGYLQYWLGVINKLKPEAVIFTICPHTGFDFIIYSIAKHLKIKTILFQYTLISDRHLIQNDFTASSPRLKKELEKNTKNYKLDELPLDIRNYYQNHTDPTKDSTHFLIKTFKKNNSGSKLFLNKIKLIANSFLDLSIVKKGFLYIKKQLGPNFRKEYIKLQSPADFSKKYVYVPLHYQPECATAPMGKIFVDQILMIKILSAALPENWLIYVKEHPFQWSMIGINYTHTRYQGYFEEIARIDKVKIISVQTDTIELIKKSQAIVTVTGSAGAEAIWRGKPAIVFGYPWYLDVPGVFKANNVESCRQALIKIQSGYTVDPQDHINYLACFDKATVRTFFFQSVEWQSKLTLEEYADKLSKIIIEELENFQAGKSQTQRSE